MAFTAVARECKREFPDEIITVDSLTHQSVWLNNPHLNNGDIDRFGEVRFYIHMHENLGNIARSFGAQIGINIVDDTPEVFLNERERRWAAETLPPGPPTVAIDVWAKWPSRRWPFERFAELAERLKAAGVRIVEVGKRVPDHFEKMESRSLAGIADTVLVDKLSVREVAALIERCDAFIGTDSGGAHLAAAVGTPQVAIYSVKRWYSRSYWNTVPVFDFKDCAPGCYAECHATEPCLERVSVDAVEGAVRLALSRFGAIQLPVAEPVRP